MFVSASSFILFACMFSCSLDMQPIVNHIGRRDVALGLLFVHYNLCCCHLSLGWSVGVGLLWLYIYIYIYILILLFLFYFLYFIIFIIIYIYIYNYNIYIYIYICSARVLKRTARFACST